MISEFPTTRQSNAEKNLASLQIKKTNEMESLRLDMSVKEDECAVMKKKLSAACARRDTLEV